MVSPSEPRHRVGAVRAAPIKPQTLRCNNTATVEGTPPMTQRGKKQSSANQPLSKEQIDAIKRQTLGLDPKSPDASGAEPGETAGSTPNAGAAPKNDTSSSRERTKIEIQNQVRKAYDHQPIGKDSRASSDDDQVGYRKPPKHSQFKPGESGNRKGRPRKNARAASSSAAESGVAADPMLEIDEIALDQLARMFTINEAGKAVEMSGKVGLFRAGLVTALKGNAHAQKTMLYLLMQLEAKKTVSLEARIKVWQRHKAEGYETLKRIEAGQTELNVPLPHPDDIVLQAGREPHFLGPIAPEVQAMVDVLLLRRDYLLLEHVYFERYAPSEAYECEAFQQRLEMVGSERCQDHLVPSGPMMAIMLLERALPPRLRWENAQLLQQLFKLEQLTRRQLEKVLTMRRKDQGMKLPRGAFYPSAAFEIRLTELSRDLVEQQQAKTKLAEDKAKQKGIPFMLSDTDALNTQTIAATLRKHGFME